MVSPNKHCCHCRPRVIVAGRTDHTGAMWVLSSRGRCGDAGRDATKRVVPLSSTPRLPREVGARALGALHPTGLAKLGLRWGIPLDAMHSGSNCGWAIPPLAPS